MTEQELILSECTTLLNMLRTHVKEVKAENNFLHSEVERLKVKVGELNEQLTQKQNEYNMLKMAKMVEITDSDLTTARNKVNKLIREVNKCINLLSEK